MRYWLTFGSSFVADQISKSIVRRMLSPGESVPIVGRFLSVTYCENPGAAFGLFAGAPWLSVLTAIASIAFGMFGRKYLAPLGPLADISVGLLSGGALGNLVDRLRFSAVTDFIDLKVWPVFNLADTCVVAGSFILAFLILRHDLKVLRS